MQVSGILWYFAHSNQNFYLINITESEVFVVITFGGKSLTTVKSELSREREREADAFSS